jgi:hypothetical protein
MEVSIMKRKMPEKHFAKTGSSCTGGQEDERLHTRTMRLEAAQGEKKIRCCTRGQGY